MATKTWVLTDLDQDLHQPDLHIEGARFRSRQLAGGLREGVHLVEMSNGALKVSVLPTRGMGIWRASQQADLDGDAEAGLSLGWQAPVRGPVHPKFVPLFAPDGLGWLDGFDELIVRCGLESNGAPVLDDTTARLIYPLHGRIANTPAHRVVASLDEATGEIALTGVVDEVRLFFNKLRLTSTVKMRPDELRFDVVDEVTNLSAAPGQLQLLYHCNFGQPLLDPGARMVMPVREMMPRDARAAEGINRWESYGNEDSTGSEQVYFFQLYGDEQQRTQAVLRNAHGTAGVRMHVDLEQMPYFTVWKNTQAAEDGYVTGLEPATNFPNPRPHEEAQGRVITLKPGERRRFELGFELLPDAAAVSAAEEDVAKLQAGREATIHPMPKPGWTDVS